MSETTTRHSALVGIVFVHSYLDLPAVGTAFSRDNAVMLPQRFPAVDASGGAL